MKKTYIKPNMCGVQIQHEMPIANSGVNSNNGIGYGGIDTEGTLEPEVKTDNFDFSWE